MVASEYKHLQECNNGPWPRIERSKDGTRVSDELEGCDWKQGWVTGPEEDELKEDGDEVKERPREGCVGERSGLSILTAYVEDRNLIEWSSSVVEVFCPHVEPRHKGIGSILLEGHPARKQACITASNVFPSFIFQQHLDYDQLQAVLLTAYDRDCSIFRTSRLRSFSMLSA
ncbi:hypothetical protein VTI28DRAFT_6040 [Corynascus sepedonium]